MRLSSRRRSPLVLALSCLLLSASGQAGGRRPLPANVEPPAGNVTWIRNGDVHLLPVNRVDGRAYLPIEEVGRLAQAQLQWQRVSEQACLSNTHGVLCFDWKNRTVRRDSDRPRREALKFENDALFVPMAYVASDHFESFTGTRLDWNERRARLQQRVGAELRIPEVERGDGRYRMVFALPASQPHHLIERTKERVWLRFVKTQVSGGSQILEGDSVLREVRVVQRRHSADVILELGENAVSNDVYFEDGRKNLVVAIAAKGGAQREKPTPLAKEMKGDVAALQAKPPHSPAPVAVPAPKPVVPARPAADNRAVRTIVIDPGHGGKDSGAVGARGTLEKEINLTFAKALAKQLSKEKGIEVVMTRERDDFLPLSQRTEIANAAQADLFVSIHCNSSLSSRGDGFETYFLSPDATDKAAEAVARLENSVVALETQKGSSSSRLGELLASMAVYNFVNESSKFAALICRSVKTKARHGKTAVKEADFYVLRGAQMPAVLVELEYLSNPVTETKLRSSRFRAEMVKGVADGVLAYLRQSRHEREAIASQYRDAMNRIQQ